MAGAYQLFTGHRLRARGRFWHTSKRMGDISHKLASTISPRASCLFRLALKDTTVLLSAAMSPTEVFLTFETHEIQRPRQCPIRNLPKARRAAGACARRRPRAHLQWPPITAQGPPGRRRCDLRPIAPLGNAR